MDYGVATGTDVHAINDGVVTIATLNGGTAGVFIEVDHGTLRSRYLHLSRLRVRLGDVVIRGQHIADTGNSGNTTGPHLHLDVGGPEAVAKAIDPDAEFATGPNRWMLDPLLLFKEEDEMKRVILVRTPEGNQWIMDMERSTAIYLDEMTREIMEAEKAAGKLEIVIYTKPQSAIDAIISSRP